MLTSMHRKRHQRAANKIFREANRIIENDDLWLGRFVVKQAASWFYDFEHNNEQDLILEYYFYDKKTKIRSNSTLTRSDRVFLLNDIMYEMNNFIIHTVKVWENEDPFKDERVDYRGRD